jgi:hypothetical protein
MEKFMLIFHNGAAEQNQSPEQMQAQMGKWFAWIDKLAKAGIYASGEPLLPGGKLVSGAGGKTVIDGPYTEGKEIVGGYFVINAADVNEAVKICEGYPDYETGGKVQVRQIMKVDM